MPITPTRADRVPEPGTRFASQVVADNVRTLRAMRRLSQDLLADRMQGLGHKKWVRATVSEVERNGRNVTVDELVSLAVALETTVLEVLDPTGIDGRGGGFVDLGGGAPLASVFAREFLRGERERLPITWEMNTAPALWVLWSLKQGAEEGASIDQQRAELDSMTASSPQEKEGRRPVPTSVTTTQRATRRKG